VTEVDAGAWVSPWPWIGDRPDVARALDVGGAGALADPTPGVSVLVVLSGSEALWASHAVAVAMARSFAVGGFQPSDCPAWLDRLVARHSWTVTYVEHFGLPGETLARAGTVILRAFDRFSLVHSGALLGIRHDICRDECTRDGSLDPECYRGCISQAL
jgi:hypothetical protein